MNPVVLKTTWGDGPETARLYYGVDVLEGLRQLPDKSVQVICTSPPYFGMRNYRVNGQIGNEETPDEYVARIVAVCRELWRVLRDDGLFFLNEGDTYADDTKWGGATGGKHVAALHGDTGIGRGKKHTGLPPKSLVGIPWRVALALQAEGWVVRNAVAWVKTNAMPSSIDDRFTCAHETVFVLSKQSDYFFDWYDVQEPASDNRMAKARKIIRDLNLIGQADGSEGKRRCRDAWLIPTSPYAEAHFACFPPALVDRMIRAGSSTYGCCPHCGAPWTRYLERVGEKCTDAARQALHPKRSRRMEGFELYGREDGFTPPPQEIALVRMKGWIPGCSCMANIPVPCVVLDPFCGSGTTGMMAMRRKRNFIGIDLNPEYLPLAKARITGLYTADLEEASEANKSEYENAWNEVFLEGEHP